MRHAEFEARRADWVRSARRASGRWTSGAPWAPVAGALLLLITVVLTVSQWGLVTGSTTGRGNSYRDGGLSILLGLAGLHLLVARGRHLITGSVAALAGIGLAAGGLLADHHHAGLAAVEVAAGALAVLCAVTAVASPVPDAPRQKAVPDGQ